MRCRGDGRDALSMYCREKVKKNLSTYQIRRPPLREERRATGTGGQNRVRKIKRRGLIQLIACKMDYVVRNQMGCSIHLAGCFVQSRVTPFEPSSPPTLSLCDSFSVSDVWIYKLKPLRRVEALLAP